MTKYDIKKYGKLAEMAVGEKVNVNGDTYRIKEIYENTIKAIRISDIFGEERYIETACLSKNEWCGLYAIQ